MKKIRKYPLSFPAMVIEYLLSFISFLISVLLLVVKEYEIAVGCIFIGSVILLIALYFSFAKGYLNYILVCTDGIRTKKNLIPWERLNITIDYVREYRLDLIRMSFCDREKWNEKNIPYIFLTKKRAEFILTYYKKKIVINDSQNYFVNPKIMSILKKHNDLIDLN